MPANNFWRSSPRRALARVLVFLLFWQGALNSLAKPPNVVLICADDLAPSMLGVYGNPHVRTPAIDRLASQGLRFNRAYCNSPVCTASRQSFLTGRYPRSVGVTQLSTPLAESELTLAEMLVAAGYETASLGKMHFNSDLRHGFQLRLDLPDHRRWLAKQPPTALPPELALLPKWRPFVDPAGIWLNSESRPYGLVEQQMMGTWLA